MGFNTWDRFACKGINAEVMMQSAELMVSTPGLALLSDLILLTECQIGTFASDDREWTLYGEYRIHIRIDLVS